MFPIASVSLTSDANNIIPTKKITITFITVYLVDFPIKEIDVPSDGNCNFNKQLWVCEFILKLKIDNYGIHGFNHKKL